MTAALRPPRAVRGALQSPRFVMKRPARPRTRWTWPVVITQGVLLSIAGGAAYVLVSGAYRGKAGHEAQHVLRAVVDSGAFLVFQILLVIVAVAAAVLALLASREPRRTPVRGVPRS